VKERTDKIDLIETKNCSSVKDNVKGMRRQATEWEKIFTKIHLRKDCYPE
jgi:hypothetical protein